MLGPARRLFLLRTPLGAAVHMPSDNNLAMSGWLDLLSPGALLFTIPRSPSSCWRWRRSAPSFATALRRAPTALNGVANRRGILEQALQTRRAADRKPTAVLLFDLDHFKTINDNFGHAVGDSALKIFADTARSQIGTVGSLGRWGGDEFVAVLFETGHDAAATIAERVQHAFEKAAAEIDGRPTHVTVSTGMVYSPSGAQFG